MGAGKTSLSAGYLIREMLRRNEAVAAITEKIFPVVVDKATLPYVCYRRSALESRAVKNAQCDTVQIEVLCYAASYDESLALAEAVRGALDSVQGETEELRLRSCILTDSEEAWQDDAYIQQLVFNLKIQ